MRCWDRMRERYILRADRTGYGYRELVEFTPGAAQLLVPDRARRLGWWLLVGVLVLVEVFGYAMVIAIGAPSLGASLEGTLGVLWGDAVYLLLPWMLVVVTVVLADHYMPAFLARHPLEVVPLQILDSESYGFFQEVHALTGGHPLRITVNGRRKGVERALRLARSVSPPPA